MYRYKCIVAYDGFNYVGWQRQKNGISIQEVIEKVIAKIFNEDISIIASGRTDAKVSAKSQTFHFDSLKNIDCFKLKNGINSYLPNDIYIKSVDIVSDLFHARYTVLYKVYDYVININEYDVFSRNNSYYCYYKLNIDNMIKASKHFIGYHDFTSFCVNPVDEFLNQKREVYSIDFKIDNNFITISFKGKGFLRYMVRMMVASLIEVGRGKLKVDDIKTLLELKRKDVVKKNADARGLTLAYVEYFKVIYLDDKYIVRKVYKEDLRLLNNFGYNEYIENLYMLCFRNKEDIIALFDEKGNVIKSLIDNIEEILRNIKFI